MSERLQIHKCNDSTTSSLIANQSKLLDKNFKPLVSRPPLVQAKLAINQPGDEYEQEADRVAEQVMRMPDPVLQRECAKCDEGEKNVLQAKESLGQVPVTQDQDVPPIVHKVLCSTGRPLDPAARAYMEPRFGHDFSNVRVHADENAAESARAVNALAYTVGRNVVFGAGQYAPRTNWGQRLIAHELTHTLQQISHYVLPQKIRPMSAIYEHEANRIAAGIEIRTFTNRKSASVPMLQRKDEKKKPPKKSPTAKPQPSKPQLGSHFNIDDAMKTSCDVKADERDNYDVQLENSFRVVGKGEPKTEILIPSLEKKSPCLFEAGKAHEEQHVKNDLEACQAFRKCIDDHMSRSLFGGDPKISYEDFVRCFNTHNNGTMKDCIADEKSAYEVSIKKATELKNEPRCTEEKSSLQENIKFWESIKDHAPNCDKRKK